MKHTHGPVAMSTREIRHKGGKSYAFVYGGEVTITIDLDKLAQLLGRKALAANNHRAALAQSAIVARANNVRMEVHDLAPVK